METICYFVALHCFGSVVDIGHIVVGIQFDDNPLVYYSDHTDKPFCTFSPLKAFY
jgi:hypothetical protein